MYITSELFKQIVSSTPLIAVDIIMQKDNSDILLGKRINKPAKGKWFVPGGRIRKSETIERAFNRVSTTELGVAIDFNEAEFFGVYEHHYNDSIYDGVSTHYVVLAYHVFMKDYEFTKDVQHESLQWFEINSEEEDIHKYTKVYMRTLCQ